MSGGSQGTPLALMDAYPSPPAAAYVLPFRRIARTLLAEQRRDGTCLLGLVRRHHGAQATAVARAPREHERRQQDHQHEAGDRDVGEQGEPAVASPRPFSIQRLEARKGYAERLAYRAVQRGSALPVSKKQRETALRIEGRQLAHRPKRQRIGRLRRGGAAAKPLLELVERRRAPKRKGHVLRKHAIAQPLPTAAAHDPLADPPL